MEKKGKVILLSTVFLSVLGIVASVCGYLDLIKSEVESGNSDWMARVEDQTALEDLLIPGSHDSGARYSIMELSGRCQDLEIKPQLEAGIRFLDIRLQLSNDNLKVIHGIVDQKLSFASVVSDVSSFLEEHPSETIIVSIKEEEEASSSSLTFEEALLEAIDGRWETSTTLPDNLGEARGKALIVSRYANNTIGIPAYECWGNPSDPESENSFALGELYVQDHYKLRNADTKKEEIVETLEHSLNSDLLHLNFLSGYLVSSFPPSYAPSIAKEINPWIDTVLEENNGYMGVLIADYVTSDFASTIIERNFV